MMSKETERLELLREQGKLDMKEDEDIELDPKDVKILFLTF